MKVSAQSIEKELTGVRKTEDQGRCHGLQRVFTTNLVAYASDPEEGYRVEKILDGLAEKHPGRYILVRPATDPAEPPLSYNLSGHCFFGDWRDKRVCCDLIRLVAQKEVIENLYGFTFSLLMSDLPVEFWWPGDLPDSNAFFNKMAEESSRVWVDSSRFSNPVHSLYRLATTWKANHPHTLLCDLNWIRIQRWRALIAELFDGEWAKALRDIQQVTIEYGEGTQPTRSFFLACWMACQLGWAFKGPRRPAFTGRLTFESPQRSVEVLLKPMPTPDTTRDKIFGVHIVTGGENPGLFTVNRHPDPNCVEARSEVNHMPAFSRVVTFEHLYDNQLLDLGLKHLEPDPIWRKVLKFAGTILPPPG